MSTWNSYKPNVFANAAYSSSKMTQPSQDHPVARATPANKSVAISDLLVTPPEQAPYDSFDHRTVPICNPTPPTIARQTVLAGAAKALQKSQLALSPPISPLSKVSNQDHAIVHDDKDPILYPEGPTTSTTAPLFKKSLSPEAQSAVDEHISSRAFEKAAPTAARVKPPTREDYGLVVCFYEDCWAKFFKSTPTEQMQWLRRERAQLKEDDRARRKVSTKTAARPIKVKPLKPRPSGIVTASMELVKLATSPRNLSKVIKPTTSRPPRPSASKPAQPRRGSDTPQPEKKRTTTLADRDFKSVPDFCPPLESLDKLPDDRDMIVPAMGNARPFEQNEMHLLPLLHPMERKLATNLRLDPATYLTSKRRIFLGRLRYFHYNKPYRKTHAQHVCNIDVNKASKLWTAFDSVGWFDEKWVRGVPAPPEDF